MEPVRWMCDGGDEPVWNSMYPKQRRTKPMAEGEEVSGTPQEPPPPGGASAGTRPTARGDRIAGALVRGRSWRRYGGWAVESAGVVEEDTEGQRGGGRGPRRGEGAVNGARLWWDRWGGCRWGREDEVVWGWGGGSAHVLDEVHAEPREEEHDAPWGGTAGRQ